MEIIIGLIIIAIGSFGQSSSYVPINKVKDWSWESFWLVQGIFAWLVFPFLGAQLAIPNGSSLLELWSAGGAAGAVIYGILWGIGGLTFGLSMRYLGVALGQSIALGTCAGFGTLFPAVFGGTDLFHGDGLVLLIGVCITLAGIAVIGYAGSLRARNMTEEEKKAAVKEFALKKGLIIAIFAGLMSACMAYGLAAGQPIADAAIANGCSALLSFSPVHIFVMFGGFLTNFVYCIYLFSKNKSLKEFRTVGSSVLVRNLLFSLLGGSLWYMQFLFLGMGQSFISGNAILMAFSWSILMSLNIVFSNFWGIVLKEWKGSRGKTIVVLCCGLLLLIFSVFFPSLF